MLREMSGIATKTDQYEPYGAAGLRQAGQQLALAPARPRPSQQRHTHDVGGPALDTRHGADHGARGGDHARDNS